MDNLTVGGSEFQQRLIYFNYDEYCDLIGGASWNLAVDRWLLSGLSQERQRAFNDIGTRFVSPDQFLFQEDPAGQYPLEVLWIKWNIFAALCRSLSSFHEDKRRPHLGIRPSNIIVTVPENVSNFIPPRWLYNTLEINKSAATLPYQDPDIPADFASRLFSRPSDFQSIYSAPVIREKSPGHEENVTVLIRSQERIRDDIEDNIRGILQLHIVSENIRPAEYSEKDVFRVKITLPPDKSKSLTIWASKIRSSEQGLSLEGTSDPETAFVWDTLERSSKNVFLNSKLSIYPTYHFPSDFYSLGMILFRTLIVNDEYDISMVSQNIDHFCRSLSPMVEGIDPDRERNILIKRFKARLIEEWKGFSKDSVLFSKKGREQGRGCSYIPDKIWYESLFLGFRLITSIPGFSFYENHGDYDLENPCLQMEKLTKVVERVRDLIKIELFGARRRNREILEVCDLLRKQQPERENIINAG